MNRPNLCKVIIKITLLYLLYDRSTLGICFGTLIHRKESVWNSWDSTEILKKISIPVSEDIDDNTDYSDGILFCLGGGGMLGIRLGISAAVFRLLDIHHGFFQDLFAMLTLHETLLDSWGFNIRNRFLFII